MEVTETGLNRCGKSCRLRWTNYLRPDLKHDSFTPQEEELIIGYHKAIGSRWSVIAQHLPGRTDNDVKNYWNTKLKKKLVKIGIDPVTHKPFSQILTDFGNVGRISSSGVPFGSFTRNFNTSLIPEQEPSCIMVEPAASNIVAIEQIQVNSMNMDRAMWDFHSRFVVSHVPIQPHLFNEIASSCCSSSSSPASLTQLNSQPSYQQAQHPLQGQLTPSSPVTWSDYLIADPVLFMEPEANDTFLSTRSSTLLQDDHLSGFNEADRKGHLHFPKDEKDALLSSGSGPAIGNLPKYNQAGVSPASNASSFVDDILDKHTEIRSQFPEILDPSFGFHDF